MTVMTPIVEQLSKLWDAVNRIPAIKWATVASVSPLAVQFDGEPIPATVKPGSTVARLSVGTRVLCVELHRRVTIIGDADQGRLPVFPLALTSKTDDQNTVTSTSFANISGASAVSFGPLSRALTARVDYTATVRSTNASVYVMLGVGFEGGLVQAPDAGGYHFTPFSSSSEWVTITGWRYVTIPAGPATSIRLQARRNGTTGTQSLNYGRLDATPIELV